MSQNRLYNLFLIICLLISTHSYCQTIPTPKEHFGFTIGDDYHLATYTQTEAYFKKLATTSKRVKLVEIGKTEEGRSQYMLIVSSPKNLENLEHYREISTKLAHAENLTELQARALASEGKAIVWIDGGLHANETVGAHQLIQTAYELSSRTDEETKKILENVIILMVHANPDGQELMSNWYMRNEIPEKRSLSNLPRLFEKYAGHDNNRDFYMLNLKESQNMARQLFINWIPQIMYNHHQPTGNSNGSVVAGPPYRDPFNYVYDPLVVTGIDAMGAAMSTRLDAEGKPGYTERAGSVYSTWFNGGLRTTTYFHNMIGLLTEITGSPTPEVIPVAPSRLIPNSATIFPVTPQPWHFKQSIDYSISLNYAVLDYASRYRDQLLFNIYRMGKNSIEKGEKDYWSLSPSKVASISKLAEGETRTNKKGALVADSSESEESPSYLAKKYYDSVMKNPSLRDPRGYIITANQADLPTTIRFINCLIRTGVVVTKATASFTVEGKSYPPGSFVIKTNQAFRPHVIDLFEPQDHPNDFLYPGGPPIKPYDAAGWTLAYQMGVQFDRILNPFEAPTERLGYGELILPKGTYIGGVKSAKGFLLDARANHSFSAANDLLKEGLEVFRTTEAIEGTSLGSFYVNASAKSKAILDKEVDSLGIAVNTVTKRPAGLKKMTAARIALWDIYGGSIPSGWMRYMMEQYHFTFDRIYAKEIDTADLRSKYDVIVFPTGAIPAIGSTRGRLQPKPASIPEEYRHTLGRFNADKTVPALKRFLEAGGSILTIGSSTNLAYHLGLPVKDALTEIVDGTEKKLPGEKFYIPGTILRTSVDSAAPAAWGMNAAADIMFDESPVFKINTSAYASGSVKPLVWFASKKSLRSGWAWGQEYLQDGVAAFETSVGKGKFYAFGPEIIFRAQSYNTYKLFMNQLYK